MKSQTLTLSGGIAAFFMGVLSLGTHPIVGIQILAFFFLGKKVTKIGAEKKAAIEEEFSEKRTVWQVLANGGLPLLFVIMSCLFIDKAQPQKISLSNCFQNECFDDRFHFVLVGSLSALSAALGDTFSSELGLLSQQQPRLITTWRKVPRGTNGGVTLYGFYAALQGGFWMGVITFAFLFDFANFSLLAHLIATSTASALVGTIADSYLGAWFEFSGESVKTGKIVNSQGKGVTAIQDPVVQMSGNAVNFLSCLFTAFVVPFLHATM